MLRWGNPAPSTPGLPQSHSDRDEEGWEWDAAPLLLLSEDRTGHVPRGLNCSVSPTQRGHILVSPLQVHSGPKLCWFACNKAPGSGAARPHGAELIIAGTKTKRHRGAAPPSRCPQARGEQRGQDPEPEFSWHLAHHIPPCLSFREFKTSSPSLAPCAKPHSAGEWYQLGKATASIMG